MTHRSHEGREHRQTDRALARAEQHYDRQNPPQSKEIKSDSDRAWEFDWLRSGTED